MRFAPLAPLATRMRKNIQCERTFNAKEHSMRKNIQLNEMNALNKSFLIMFGQTKFGQSRCIVFYSLLASFPLGTRPELYTVSGPANADAFRSARSARYADAFRSGKALAQSFSFRFSLGPFGPSLNHFAKE